MEFADIDTSQFIGRDDRLAKIERYRGLIDAPPKFPIMFYRTNLDIHSKRVQWLMDAILPDAITVFPGLNPERCRTIAQVHDDPETDPNWGDVQLGDKERWSQEQLALNHLQEMRSIEFVAERSPHLINGYNYQQLMIEAAEKETLEAQLVSFADKFDGYGEACHEVYGGNGRFIGVWRGYTRRLRQFVDTYPNLAPILNLPHIPFLPPSEFDYQKIAFGKRYHTPESIHLPTENHHYDFWRKVSIDKGAAKGIYHLTTRMESYGDIH